MRFIYDENNKLNGVFSFLFKSLKDNYFEHISASSDSVRENNNPYNVIDRTNSTFITDPDIKRESILKICLNIYKVKITGFSIDPGVGECLLTKWKFGASNSPEILESDNIQEYSHTFNKEDTEHFEWNNNQYYKCFVFYFNGSSTCNEHPYIINIRHFEVFGDLKNIYPPFTCNRKIYFKFSILSLICFLI